MSQFNETDVVERDAYRLFRVRKTLFKMMRNRDYLVAENDLSATFNDFKQQFGHPPQKAKLFHQFQGKDDPNKLLNVYFSEEDSLDVKHISVIADQMQTQKVYRAIIVVVKGATPFAKKALAEAASKYFVEIFKVSELLVDITEHELVPKHEVLTSDEKATLMAKYKLSDSQLPRMMPDDPISRYFGLQRGQVVKVIRSSETAGRYVTYRIVY